MRAPFPYFGGKSAIAAEVWRRFGDVPNYLEPFFGSGAVYLSRPHPHRTATLNDADGFISNFWRAIQHDPGAVAEWAAWPVSECDLHARHAWLVAQTDSLQARLEGDPDYYDAKIAGWWVWGICCWIGSGWCSGDGPWQSVDGRLVNVSDDNPGVIRQIPNLGFAHGIQRKRPDLHSGGQGINLIHPQNCDGQSKFMEHRLEYLIDYFIDLANVLGKARICCGDWSRVCGPTPTIHKGITGIFLDPPYGDSRDDRIYRIDTTTVLHDVREWCLRNGDHPLMRIALCGYAGEHDVLAAAGWSVFQWKAHGGMGNQSANGRGRENSYRETIWFSPHCLPEKGQINLFGEYG